MKTRRLTIAATAGAVSLLLLESGVAHQKVRLNMGSATPSSVAIVGAAPLPLPHMHQVRNSLAWAICVLPPQPGVSGEAINLINSWLQISGCSHGMQPFHIRF